MYVREGHCLVKRLDTLESSLRRAGRSTIPIDGTLEPHCADIDPSLISHTPWPISPHLLQTLELAVNEAIAAGLTVRDGAERMVQVLADFGIFLSSDDLVELATKDSCSCT